MHVRAAGSRTDGGHVRTHSAGPGGGSMLFSGRSQSSEALDCWGGAADSEGPG